MLYENRTEQNNMFIDLISYRSSSYIRHLNTCISEREKCGDTKERRKKERNKQKLYGNKSMRLFVPMSVKWRLNSWVQIFMFVLHTV